jgi:hypothetical protein
MLLLLFSFCLSAGALFPGGAPEENRLKQGRVKAYLVSPGDQRPNDIFLEQFYLAPFLSSYIWSDFTVSGNDIKIETTGGYRITRKDLSLEEPFNGFTLYEYQIETDYHGAVKKTPQKTSTLKFHSSNLVSKEGKLLYQPFQYALLSVIKTSGAPSGSVRLRSLTYRKSGRFEAKVEISR